MIKDYKYTEIMCDLCGCNKQVKNRDELSGVMHDEFVNIELPATRRGVKYWAKEFYLWHNRLTGSCEYGRKQFAKNHGIDIANGEMTVKEFLNLTKESYGGEVIKRIIEKLGKNGGVQ